MTPARSAVLTSVAARRAARGPGGRLRVGVDGVCGSGKTTFAGDLAGFVAAAGRPVVLIDSDGLHHVRARRYRQGRESARGYYDDAYDFGSLAERVLLPLGPADAIALFAATFIQRGQLRDLWDEVIYLDVGEEVATVRGVARDTGALGGPAAARAAYEARYMAACRLYVAEQDPAGRASILIDNTDPGAPVIRRLQGAPAVP